MTAEAVDVRVDKHEKQCELRYEQIMEAIADLRSDINVLQNRAWAAVAGLIGVLVVVCVGLVAFIFTRLPH